MKKRNIFLISVIVLIIIFLVFLYIFRLKFSKETNLLCTFKGYNTTLKTNIDTIDKKIKELQDEIKKLNKSINEQKQTIEEQNIKIDQLVEELNKKPNLKEYEAQGDIYIKLKSKDKIYY